VYSKLLGDARLFLLLLKIDLEIAARIRAEGCRRCGGVLHSARYPRKPRGARVDLGEAYDRRESFCCSDPDCRRRTTPSSVRFLGRTVYLGVVKLVLCALAVDASAEEVARLRELIGADVRTVRRWRQWWQRVLPSGPFWRSVAGRFDRPVDGDRMPLSLLERFRGSVFERVVAVLGFLVPITTASMSGGLLM
jgi:hypothetical protein